MFLKGKHYGTAKGRSCTDGQKQRYGYQNKDATSPSVTLELEIITSSIDVHKMRDMHMVDIHGALLTADIDNYVIMVL